jgi:hypothetical protein
MIFKFFSFLIHALNAPRIKEVFAIPLIISWIKCNIEGTTKVAMD